MKIQFNKQFPLLLTGIIIIMFILWNRIIRVRLPRDIPYVLTDFSFIILFFICITFIVILVLTIKTYMFPNLKPVIIGSTIRVFLQESLLELDYKLRCIPFIFTN
jgi:glucan phosphoethanolaminetransferase (alkaline phosphatase superfamily)